MHLSSKISKSWFSLAVFVLAQASLVSALDGSTCIKSLNTIYDAESKVADDSKLRQYILCPNTEYYVALNFAEDGKPLDGQYPIPIGRPNIHVICGEDGSSENNCQLVRGLVHVGIVDEFGTGATATNVLLQGLTFFRATSVNVIAMIGGDITIQDCVFKRNRNVAAIYAVAPHNTLRRLSRSSSNDLDNFLNARRRATETSWNMTTKADLHIRVSNSVFSDNVLGASPGADTTAIIYSVGASVELTNSVVVGTTKDAQKVEELPHLIYVESAPIVLRNNCFMGNDDGIASVIAKSAMISSTSNFNQRTTSVLPKSNCDFIAHNATGKGYVCHEAEAPVCTAYPQQQYRFPCVTYLDDIYFSEWDITDSSITRTYILCPDTTFRVGSRHDDDGTPLGGSYPIILGRSNIRVLCGADGRLENNCAVVNGVVQVAHFDEYQTSGEPIDNALVQGVSFSGASAINALVSGSGDVIFRNCVFEGNSNVAAVYVQGLEPLFRGGRKLHSVVSEVVNPSDGRMLDTATTQDGQYSLQAQFDSCSFINNTIGSATNPISGLISNHNAILTLTNSMIVDTLNQASTENLGYYAVSYIIGNFNGDMTLEGNCIFDNEVNIAPVLNTGVMNASLNSGRQAMVPPNATALQLPVATARFGSAEQEALNITSHHMTTNASFPEPDHANITLDPVIDTRNARCEFIADVEEDVLGTLNPELVSFTCKSFDSEVCSHPDAPTNAPSLSPTSSQQPSSSPSVMPSGSPTVQSHHQTTATSGILPEESGGSDGSPSSSAPVVSAKLALLLLSLVCLFS